MLDRRDFLLTAAAALAGTALPNVALAECKATSSATKGPFWRPDAPFTNDIRRKGGEAIVVHGVVRSARTCQPIANALLDLWHADHTGEYDDVLGRARVRTNSDGAFSFSTTRPAPYGMRPAHIHFVLSAEGHRSLVTQLYFEGDPYLESDPLRAVRPDLVSSVRNGRCRFDVFL